MAQPTLESWVVVYKKEIGYISTRLWRRLQDTWLTKDGEQGQCVWCEPTCVFKKSVAGCHTPVMEDATSGGSWVYDSQKSMDYFCNFS